MISLVIAIFIGGLIVWGVYLSPIPIGFKRAIYVVVVVCLIAYVLYATGILPMHDVPVPQLRPNRY